MENEKIYSIYNLVADSTVDWLTDRGFTRGATFANAEKFTREEARQRAQDLKSGGFHIVRFISDPQRAAELKVRKPR